MSLNKKQLSSVDVAGKRVLVAEEQAALDQLGQQYCTSRFEFLAERARLLQMLEGAAPSKLARANAATLRQHQSQLASLTEEVAQQTQAIAKQGRATSAASRPV